MVILLVILCISGGTTLLFDSIISRLPIFRNVIMNAQVILLDKKGDISGISTV